MKISDRRGSQNISKCHMYCFLLDLFKSTKTEEICIQHKCNKYIMMLKQFQDTDG